VCPIVERFPTVEAPPQKCLTVIYATGVRNRQDPRFGAAFLGIELTGMAEDFKKYMLGQIFSLASVAQDLHAHAKDDHAMTRKQDRQCILLAGGESSEERFVRGFVWPRCNRDNSMRTFFPNRRHRSCKAYIHPLPPAKPLRFHG
jgi:hypothetical protein